MVQINPPAPGTPPNWGPLLNTELTKLADHLNLRPAARVWTGASYPERVPDSINVFIGPENPSALMDPAVDIWLDSNAPSNDTLLADINNPASTLGSAVRAASNERVVIPVASLAPGDNRAPQLGPWVTTANHDYGIPAWYFPAGETTLIAGVFERPAGWAAGRVSIYWSHKNNPGTGNVRWMCFARPFRESSSLLSTSGGSGEAVSPVTGGFQRVLRSDFNGILDAATPSGLIQLSIMRHGSTTTDTFTGHVGILSVVLERTA